MMSSVSQAPEPWRLVILGDGEERHILERLIANLKVPDVSLPGFRQVEELPGYYGLASAFIHPALQEQWGLVINEAMASELLVLVSENCGCRPNLVIEGITGYSFKPDDIQFIAQLLVRVSLGEINRDEIGVKAGNLIAQWGLNRFSDGMRNAYFSAVSRQIYSDISM
jgi:glycosyltransferase involved in cell wall biosynthesis